MRILNQFNRYIYLIKTLCYKIEANANLKIKEKIFKKK